MSPLVRKVVLIAATSTLFWTAINPAVAAVVLPRVISSHMVLQENMPVPIWGTAAPNEKVTVAFRDQTKAATADAQGKWMVKLDPLKPGPPGTLTVSASNTLTLTDVLVGEVWVGSGQSNLDTPVNMYLGDDAPMKAARSAAHPQMRLYHSTSGTGWQEANNVDVIGGFSAQLFYFGLLLQQKLGVPVGVMEGAVAGSPSAPFLPQEGYSGSPRIQAIAAKWDASHPIEAQQQKYERDIEKWKSDVTAAMSAAPSPSPAFPGSSSPANNPPATTGIDFDHVPAAILAKHGKPARPVRAVDIRTGDAFEKHIRAMVPYAIRGVLWDQGEGGAGIREVPIWQADLMSALIPSWRKLWGQGDFAWLYVQKPSGGGTALNLDDPTNKGAKPFEPLPKTVPPSEYFSGLHREGDDVSAQNPNTFLVETTDLIAGLHPINKSGYATRDLQVALGAVYGQPVEYYGPKFDSAKVEGNKVRISYTHVGKGLAIPVGQKLQGFCLAGSDKKFYWANAEIDGTTVVLSSPQVPSPVTVLYAWTWPLAWANLFNVDGLPARTFKADLHGS